MKAICIVKVIRLQNPLPNATLTASGDAPLAMAPIETTTTAIATKMKASGNQRSAHAVKAMAIRTKAPSGFVGPPDARPGAAAVAIAIASPPKFAATLKADDLVRVHDVQRIERPLDRAHGRKRRLAVLGRHILHLALADAMLAGAGAVHRQGAFDQPFEEAVNARDFVGIIEVDSQRDVEIAVADMADDRGGELAFGNVALRRRHAFGEPRDRHADVGRNAEAG